MRFLRLINIELITLREVSLRIADRNAHLLNIKFSRLALKTYKLTEKKNINIFKELIFIITIKSSLNA